MFVLNTESEFAKEEMKVLDSLTLGTIASEEEKEFTQRSLKRLSFTERNTMTESMQDRSNIVRSFKIQKEAVVVA